MRKMRAYPKRMVSRERERERRKRQIVDVHIRMLRKIFGKITDLGGTPTLILTWRQTLEVTGKKYPFLKNAIRQTLIREHLVLLKGQSESKSFQSSMATMDDLDIDKLYTELPNVDDEELKEAFEELLNNFYNIARVLFGSIVKFPIEL